MPSRSYRYFRPGDRYLIAFIAFLSAFPPLSTDMYLPALPTIGETLHAGESLVASTISGFLLVFALSMLVWGPISDKYGRRPVLVGGSIVYIISSAAIALCGSIWTLLLLRLVQALGSGAACAMALAMVKDIFRGRLMERVVSLVQAATILAPMLAPVLGGAMLWFTNWRGIFWCLSLCGVLALFGSLALHETCTQKSETSLLGVFARYGDVLRDRAFLYPLLLFSAMAMPFMSYLGACSFIFQDSFHVSPQAFSLFFAVNAFASLAGPLMHLRFFSHLPRNKVIAWDMGIMAIFGVATILLGYLGPIIFTLLFIPVSIFGNALRPPSTILLLQSHQGDTGIVTALINCGGLIFGSISMFLATLVFWPTPIIAVGAISAAGSGICLLAWLFVQKNEQK